MINILSVKWGTKYSRKYVNNLYKGVKANIKIPYTFNCFTDNPSGLDSGIITYPLPAGIPYWWNKLYLFSKDMPLKGRMFYIDLDTVITGDISKIASTDEPFVLLQDVYHKEGWGSGLMAWDTDKVDVSHLWENYYPRAQSIHEKYWPHGDQVWIQQHLGLKPAIWQNLYRGEILSLKVDCIRYIDKPSKAKIVFYHGKPSIEESIRMPNFKWIKRYWK